LTFINIFYLLIVTDLNVCAKQKRLCHMWFTILPQPARRVVEKYPVNYVSKQNLK